MLEQIFIINYFEHAVLDLKEEGLIHGPVHTGVGQEAIAAGIGLGLDKNDMISSTHRAHHHYLGKVLAYYNPPTYNALTNNITDKISICRCDGQRRVSIHIGFRGSLRICQLPHQCCPLHG